MRRTDNQLAPDGPFLAVGWRLYFQRHIACKPDHERRRSHVNDDFIAVPQLLQNAHGTLAFVTRPSWLVAIPQVILFRIKPKFLNVPCNRKPFEVLATLCHQ